MKCLFKNFPSFLKGIRAFFFFMFDNVELNFSYQMYQTIGPTAKKKNIYKNSAGSFYSLVKKTAE